MEYWLERGDEREASTPNAYCCNFRPCYGKRFHWFGCVGGRACLCDFDVGSSLQGQSDTRDPRTAEDGEKLRVFLQRVGYLYELREPL